MLQRRTAGGEARRPAPLSRPEAAGSATGRKRADIEVPRPLPRPLALLPHSRRIRPTFAAFPLLAHGVLYTACCADTTIRGAQRLADNQADKPPTGVFRRSLRMARGWYTSEERRTAWALTAAALALTVLQVSVALQVNRWHRDFFNALERHDAAAMTSQVWLFPLLAALTMAMAVAQLWSRQMLALSWRRWLVHHLQERWLDRARHYHMGLMPDAADNPDQRISENT